MKIFYYSKTCFGDCDFPLIKALIDQGHDVKVLYRISPHSMHTTIFDIEQLFPKNEIYKATDYKELRRFTQYLPLDNIYISNETTGKFGIKSAILALKELLFIWRNKCDIIHYVEDFDLFHLLPFWFLRKKLVVTIHDGKPHIGEGKWKGFLGRKIIKTYVRSFILLNKCENDIFIKKYDVSPSKVFNSHLGFYDILKAFGNNDLKPYNYILFFGRISKYKGIEYLLEAIENVHKHHPSIRLIVAGSGAYYFDKTPYEKLQYIEFINRFISLDELSDLIRGALFTVCPYIEATQSGVICSSFAFAKPVIATRVGGLPEMIKDGIDGVLVNPCNSSEISDAILKLLNSPHLLDILSANIAQESSNGKGSWQSIAKEYISIYNNHLYE